MSSVDALVRKAIELYNRYRAPEAEARLVKMGSDVIELVFKGSFCHTCGVLDWIEDFKYVAEDLGLDLELVEVEDSGFEEMIARFRIKGVRGCERC